MFRLLLLSVVWLLLTTSSLFAESFTVTLQVIDEDKKPVAKADVSLYWEIRNGKMTPSNPRNIATGANGKATLIVDDWHEKRPVLVFSQDRTLGGFVNVSREDEKKELTVTLGPVVRMKAKFSCKELNTAPKWINTMISRDGIRAPFTQHQNETAELDLLLPPGTYKLHSYGTDVQAVNQKVTIDLNRSEYDLGTVDMKANAVAKLRGKPCPDWTILAARGMKPDAKLSDFKGKWVYLEFWGFWCDPCCARAIPEMMALYEAHADHRDKFEIIAIHNSTVNSIEEMDEKTKYIREHYWQGKALPFPQLIDKDNKTIDALTIRAFPTALLIDPEGKLVGDVTAEDLEAKLPPLPIAKRWAMHRDLQKHVIWSFEPPRDTLTNFAEVLKDSTQCEVEFDEGALKAKGLKPDSPVPGILFGIPITLRTIEQHFLAPQGLGISPSPDGKKLLITKRAETKEEPSYLQKYRSKELNERLDRVPKSDAKEAAKPLVINDQPLLGALKRIGQDFNLPFASTEPLPAVKVSGTISPKELRQSLTKFLEPAGLTFEVWHEVLLLKPKK